MATTGSDGFARFFAESGAALRRYVRRRVGSPEATEEIVQEAFLRTYEQGAAVRTPRAFLFSIARNLASKSRRHERVVENLPWDEAHTQQIHPDQRSPEESLLFAERIHLLRAAVERLPPQCRAAFALKVFHDCSYQDIAGRLGGTVKTVEKHISLALRRTHQDLKRHYETSAGSGPQP